MVYPRKIILSNGPSKKIFWFHPWSMLTTFEWCIWIDYEECNLEFLAWPFANWNPWHLCTHLVTSTNHKWPSSCLDLPWYHLHSSHTQEILPNQASNNTSLSYHPISPFTVLNTSLRLHQMSLHVTAVQSNTFEVYVHKFIIKWLKHLISRSSPSYKCFGAS